MKTAKELKAAKEEQAQTQSKRVQEEAEQWLSDNEERIEKLLLQSQNEREVIYSSGEMYGRRDLALSHATFLRLVDMLSALGYEVQYTANMEYVLAIGVPLA